MLRIELVFEGVAECVGEPIFIGEHEHEALLVIGQENGDVMAFLVHNALPLHVQERPVSPDFSDDTLHVFRTDEIDPAVLLRDVLVGFVGDVLTETIDEILDDGVNGVLTIQFGEIVDRFKCQHQYFSYNRKTKTRFAVR